MESPGVMGRWQRGQAREWKRAIMGGSLLTELSGGKVAWRE